MTRRPVGMAMPVQYRLQAVLELVFARMLPRVCVVVVAVILVMVGGDVQGRRPATCP